MTTLRALFTTTALLLCFAASACDLRVGWEEWKPYFYEENGHLQGAEYEYLQQLADAINCHFTYVKQPWLQALESLDKGQLDLLTGASKSADGRFSAPYRYEEVVLVTPVQQAPADALVWLSFSRVGVVRGYPYPQVLADALQRAASSRQHAVSADSELLTLLQSGQIDGYLTERVIAGHHQAQAAQPLAVSPVAGAEKAPVYLKLGKQLSGEQVDELNTAIETFSF